MIFPQVHPKITDLLASRGVKPGYIIGLDSATAELSALAKYLHGKDFPAGGIAPSVTALGLNVIGHLPSQLIEIISTWSGWFDASSPSVVDRVREETISRWVVNQYPKKRYPAIMIGSTNGAAVHLCAALGIPWLPQTLLTCIRHFVDPDEPKQELEWAKGPAQELLKRNPNLAVYQMHDPNQDRLKVGHVTYFRMKRIRLGAIYEQFLKENLEPGGTILLLECQYNWLSTCVNVSEAGGDRLCRHLFQFGGKGSLAPEDYFRDSQQIADFLRRRGSKHRQWNPPTPDGRFPESEWGFEPALREDVERFAREHGLKVRQIVFDFPQDLSPLVADLYRWWYQERDLPTNRLFVESFTLLQPWWMLRLGLVPFWVVFNDRMSATRLNIYLDTNEPYDEIYANLFSNGLYGLGIAPIEEWRSIINRARNQSRFVGVDEQRYPRDIASMIRYYTELKRLDGCYPIPEPLKIYQLDNFLAQAGDRYPVRWIDYPTTSSI
ncbi:MAG: hypothetical protein SAK29_19580 [Scytonema sp. PMC 1069.18]|nr:hypothetical protein [Scytonema sp. PMC 1069.18]MEC4885315.1 hypothetical protein [Scytonema sp. PMC 1070.18]